MCLYVLTDGGENFSSKGNVESHNERLKSIVETTKSLKISYCSVSYLKITNNDKLLLNNILKNNMRMQLCVGALEMIMYPNKIMKKNGSFSSKMGGTYHEIHSVFMN